MHECLFVKLRNKKNTKKEKPWSMNWVSKARWASFHYNAWQQTVLDLFSSKRFMDPNNKATSTKQVLMIIVSNIKILIVMTTTELGNFVFTK